MFDLSSMVLMQAEHLALHKDDSSISIIFTLTILWSDEIVLEFHYAYLKKKNSSLVSAIYSYHGGTDKVAKILGYKKNTMYEADDGHYVSSYYEFVVDNILSSYDVPHSTQPIIIKKITK